jgi:hypothetical protein
MMDLVTITIECTREAADTLLPLLIKARMLSHQNQSKWCAFFVDGERAFKLGSITAEDSQGPVEADTTAVWESSASFEYNMSGKDYEHVEQQVFLSDAGDDNA